MPLRRDMVLAIAGVALAKGDTAFAVILLIGFACLLRTGEMCNLKVADVFFLRNKTRACLLLHATKTGKRSGEDEQVLVHDTAIVGLLGQVIGTAQSEQLVYPGGSRVFIRDLRSYCTCLGYPTLRISGYSVRRGGATYHFAKHGSLSRTTVAGRWADAKTARIYIDSAMAQSNEWQLSKESTAMSTRARDCALAYLATVG